MNKVFLSVLFLFLFSSSYAQWLDKHMWGLTGEVTAFLQSGNDVYAGGNFRYSADIVKGMAILDSNFTHDENIPRFNGPVYFIAEDGSGGYYAGGDFTNVDGQPRKFFVHLLSDGSVDENLTTVFNSSIFCGSENDSLIVLGGYFTKINDTLRTRIAVIRKNTGEVLNYSMLDSTRLRILDIELNDSLIICGGEFVSSNGGRSYLIGYNYITNTVLDSMPIVNGNVLSVDMKGDTLLLSGYFNLVGDSVRSGTAALSLTTNQVLDWNPGPLRDIFAFKDKVYALRYSGGGKLEEFSPHDGNIPGRGIQLTHFGDKIYVDDDHVYVHDIWTTNSPPFIRVRRDSLIYDSTAICDLGSSAIFLKTSGGKYLLGGGFNTINHRLNEGLIKFNNLTSERDTLNFGVKGNVNCLAAADSILYLGGYFSEVLGKPRSSLAAIDLRSMTLTNWTPTASGSISSIAIEGDSIYIGGGFTSVNDSSRRFAAVLNKKGELQPWNHYFNNGVTKIIIGDSSFYILGHFDTVDYNHQFNFAAFDKSSGNLLPLKIPGLGGPDRIYDAVEDGEYIYIGGGFAVYDGFTQNNFAAVNKYTGRLKADFRPQIFWAGIYDLQMYDSVFYIAGSFYFGGITPKRDNFGIVKKDGTFEESFMPNPGNTVSSLLATDEYTYIGGWTDNVDGFPIVGIARFKTPEITSVSDEGTIVPLTSVLYQNYPNPFNSTTTVRFYIQNDSPVLLEVYDILGRKVKTITNEFLRRGEYTYSWTGKDNNNKESASGVYFLNMRTSGTNLTKKMIMLK